VKVYRYKSSDIPEVEEIGPEIFRIVLPQPFYAPNNIYLIHSGEPSLIDTGYILNLGILQRALKKFGLSLKKIQHIFYTHNHIDHISAALNLRYYTDAKMYGMLGMANYIGDFRSHQEHQMRAETRLIYKGIQDIEFKKLKLEKLKVRWERFFKAYGNATQNTDKRVIIDTELVEGDVIEIGKREIGFLHTPGHNRWHLTPYILNEGIYFTGDLVLENISSIFSELDGDLALYHNSLERLMNLPMKRLLPGHGEEPIDPKRAVKLLSKTLHILERGVIRRLRSGIFDLHSLTVQAMGEKVIENNYYVVALAIIHSIVHKLIKKGDVKIIEVDPPYEKYEWAGLSTD
jgi:glyoxylase-like metal-dependent hydrolase (beta-lactamase superfamily II)